MDSVKIDSELLREIEDFLKKKENRIRYASKKQFVDVAVFELLNAENRGFSATSALANMKEMEKTINQNKLNDKIKRREK